MVVDCTASSTQVREQPVAAKDPMEGSQSSALAPLLPAIKTLPLFSKVAVGPGRGVVMLPVDVNVPVRGS
jgi:hypothetical protein